MGFVRETNRRTNEVARRWSTSGKRFGYPSANAYARQLVKSGRSLVKKVGGK